MDSEKIKNFFMYLDNLGSEADPLLLESIRSGFSSLYEYRIDTTQPSDDLMEVSSGSSLDALLDEISDSLSKVRYKYNRGDSIDVSKLEVLRDILGGLCTGLDSDPEVEQPILEDSLVRNPLDIKHGEGMVLKKLSEVRSMLEKLISSKVISEAEKMSYLRDIKRKFEEEYGVSLFSKVRLEGVSDVSGVLTESLLLVSDYIDNLKK